MKLYRTQAFDSQFKNLPPDVQNRVDKQLSRLVENPRHPSLRLHKMHGRDQWEISVTMNYRITLSIVGEEYILRGVGKHDILKK